ncbi:MAG: FtsX-like permease family protein [Calditrichaeota bacterium]|nr:MAG: FtsX-like permease family protein [Calditrichota bacterium]
MLQDTFYMALEQLRDGKLRSLLTLLGITIGIATVIAIVSVLEGFFANISKDLNALGAHTFQIEKRDRNAGVRVGMTKLEKRPDIKKELADYLRRHCQSCAQVGAEVWQGGQVIRFKERHTNPNISVAGGGAEFFPNNGYYISNGRALTKEDEHSRRNVVVLGMDVVDKLFPFEDPLGQTVKINGARFRVVGYMERLGMQSFGGSKDNLVIIPLTTFEALYGRERSVNITVSVRQGVPMQQAMDEAIGLTRRFRKVAPGEPDNFGVFNNQTLADTFEGIATQVQWAASLLGMIALLVGSIGVMNIMLVTVTERTREIGIRKAVGATRASILTQFLQESVLLSMVGGMLGILLGLGLSGAASLVLKIPFVAPIGVVVIALLVTALVGILAGMYPAWKAARMNPINALRYE